MVSLPVSRSTLRISPLTLGVFWAAADPADRAMPASRKKRAMRCWVNFILFPCVVFWRERLMLMLLARDIDADAATGIVTAAGWRRCGRLRRAAPFIGHRAWRWPVPAGIAIIIARQILAHLDHAEHAAHIE